MSYPCTSCGACCRRIKTAVELMQELDPEFTFPYKWGETGTCEMLDENNLCKVYDHRPTICNIDKMNALLQIPGFYELNIAACNKMIVEDKLDEKYLI